MDCVAFFTHIKTIKLNSNYLYYTCRQTKDIPANKWDGKGGKQQVICPAWTSGALEPLTDWWSQGDSYLIPDVIMWLKTQDPFLILIDENVHDKVGKCLYSLLFPEHMGYFLAPVPLQPIEECPQTIRVSILWSHALLVSLMYFLAILSPA